MYTSTVTVGCFSICIMHCQAFWHCVRRLNLVMLSCHAATYCVYRYNITTSVLILWASLYFPDQTVQGISHHVHSSEGFTIHIDMSIDIMLRHMCRPRLLPLCHTFVLAFTDAIACNALPFSLLMCAVQRLMISLVSFECV